MGGRRPPVAKQNGLGGGGLGHINKWEVAKKTRNNKTQMTRKRMRNRKRKREKKELKTKRKIKIRKARQKGEK